MNTVLMPSNVDDLAAFPKLDFWDVLESWHIIPVKGHLASGWNETLRERAVAELRRVSRTGGCVEVIGPLCSGFGSQPLGQLRKGRYTEAAATGLNCVALQRLLYIDAAGDVLPCNSISWEFRHQLRFGNLNHERLGDILSRRQERLEHSKGRDARACFACDPLNVSNNQRAAGDLASEWG